jgi:hypothetical protein
MTLTRTLATAIAVAAIAAPAAQAEPTYSHDTPGKTAAPVDATQDLRSPDTRDVAEPRSDLTIDAPGATAAGSASTRGPAQPVAPAVTDDATGTDWTAIGLGLAVSLAAITGIVALTTRTRRHRVAA